MVWYTFYLEVREKIFTKQGKSHVKYGDISAGSEGVKLHVYVVHRGQEVLAAAHLLAVVEHAKSEVGGVVRDPQLEGCAELGVEVGEIWNRLGERVKRIIFL